MAHRTAIERTREIAQRHTPAGTPGLSVKLGNQRRLPGEEGGWTGA